MTLPLAALKTLLIVDDSPLIRRMISDVLGADFDSILHAQDGQDGVEMAVRSHPDLVLLDLEMPRLNGLEACAQIRANPDLANVPVVMLTSRDAQADVEAAFAAGATDYLVKPFAAGQLRARLRVWMLRGGVT
jgi:DNA-binding response OmpR family regulator